MEIVGQIESGLTEVYCTYLQSVIYVFQEYV